jgi:hypothetical protein
MEKVFLLTQQRDRDRERDKTSATAAEQANRLTHAVMNQLTIIYLSCAKLRRSLGAEPSRQADSEIQIIESAVEKIAAEAEALCFRLEKINRSRAKTGSGKSHKRVVAKTKLSFISPRQKP